MKIRNKLLACSAILALSAPAYAQQGNFFGGGGGITPPGAVGGLENEGDNGAGPTSSGKSKSSSSPSPGMATGGNSGGDYTADEKRMQKKYKDNVKHAKDLIDRGDSMMKAAKGNTNHKDYKKGKILKEVGEKALADLQSNNPFPEPEKPVKATTNKKDGTKQEL